jgi:acyl-Coa thioesterase superfamily protein/acyl-CoA thioesterase superfamily protein
MTPEAVFIQDGDTYTATELGLGPWAPGALHGGAPAALIAHVLAQSVSAQDTDPLRLARITYEFVRPVPLGPLSVRVEQVRPGRRMTLLDAFLIDPDGVEVTRARGLLLRAAAIDATELEPPPFPGPEAAEASDWSEERPMFATHAMDIRFVRGRFRERGASTAWFRLRAPLIAGEPTFPLDRAAAAGDFGNGIASVLSWDEHVFINPDLTLYLEREPVDEWVALQAEMRVLHGSVSVAESVLWDRRGRIGRAVQSLLVGPRPAAAGGTT